MPNRPRTRSTKVGERRAAGAPERLPHEFLVGEGAARFRSRDRRRGRQGNWTGFDTDFCRALAAAISTIRKRSSWISLSSKDRLTALQSGEIDVLARTTTWTLSRDAGIGLNFTAVNYYDGQGFEVRRSANIKSVKELDGASICVARGPRTNSTSLTTSARNDSNTSRRRSRTSMMS